MNNLLQDKKLREEGIRKSKKAILGMLLSLAR